MCSTLVNQVLNIPLVAVACATIEVPAALAHWCSHRRGRRGEKASSGSPAASPTSAAAAAAPASTGSSIEEGVHVAIADELYHPQQLLTMERVKEALRGVALYTVDSSCVCPVNTYRGGRATVARQVATAAAATEPSEFSSREDFRQAQVSYFHIIALFHKFTAHFLLVDEFPKHDQAGVEERRISCFIGHVGRLLGRAGYEYLFFSLLDAFSPHARETKKGGEEDRRQNSGSVEACVRNACRSYVF